MIVCDECIMAQGNRRRKKFPDSGQTERKSPSGMRSVGGQRFCEHGVPETGNCSVRGCWNNMVDPEPERRPILGLIPLRKVIDDAADEIERERRKSKPKKREKPKPEPPPLTGRAPKAYDGEEV